MLKKVVIIVLVLGIAYATTWLFTDWSIPGSKQCTVKTDCELIKSFRHAGCWSRKPIKIGAVETAPFTGYIDCECIDSQCQPIVDENLFPSN